ncbi:hypothetical protein [Nostoc sp. JL34]
MWYCERCGKVFLERAKALTSRRQ